MTRSRDILSHSLEFVAPDTRQGLNWSLVSPDRAHDQSDSKLPRQISFSDLVRPTKTLFSKGLIPSIFTCEGTVKPVGLGRNSEPGSGFTSSKSMTDWSTGGCDGKSGSLYVLRIVRFLLGQNDVIIKKSLKFLTSSFVEGSPQSVVSLSSLGLL